MAVFVDLFDNGPADRLDRLSVESLQKGGQAGFAEEPVVLVVGLGYAVGVQEHALAGS